MSGSSTVLPNVRMRPVSASAVNVIATVQCTARSTTRETLDEPSRRRAVHRDRAAPQVERRQHDQRRRERGSRRPSRRARAARATSVPAAGSGRWSRARRMLVNCGWPERISLHTGWLLSGWRPAAAAAAFASAASLRIDRRRLRRRAATRRSRMRRPRATASRRDTDRAHHDDSSYEPIRLYSFWFCVRLRMSRSHICLVAVERRRRVRRLVGLALVLALLVVDDLRTLAATGEHQRGHRAAGDDGTSA